VFLGVALQPWQPQPPTVPHHSDVVGVRCDDLAACETSITLMAHVWLGSCYPGSFRVSVRCLHPGIDVPVLRDGWSPCMMVLAWPDYGSLCDGCSLTFHALQPKINGDVLGCTAWLIRAWHCATNYLQDQSARDGALRPRLQYGLRNTLLPTDEC
jgi:hypothetical protein